MGYTVVKSFERGIDTRRLIDTTEPGTLLEGRDCHITLGGELEKRAAFVNEFDLPATTVGLWVTEGRVIHTWGDAATEPAGMPPNSVYHSIPEPVHQAHPGDDPPTVETPGTPLARILSVEEFNGKLFVTAQYEDDHIVHWWDDEPLVIPPNPPVEGGGPPPDGSPANKPQASLLMGLNTFPETTPDVHITSIYLLSPSSTFNFGVDAFLIVPEDSVVSGYPKSDIVVTMPTSAQEIAAAVMAAVNAFVPPVTGAAPVIVKAQATLSTVLFWIDHAGPDYNGWRITMTFSGPGRVTPTGGATFTGGVTPAPTPGVPSTPPSGPIPGDPIVKGTFTIAHNERILAVQNSFLNYSEIRNPGKWTDEEKHENFIDHSMIANRSPNLISMADYAGDLAVFAKRHIFVWHIDLIPTQNVKKQALHGTGTFAPHSVTPWGQSDVMYLDTSGIRSLRARDSSEQAFAADIGNLVDSLVREKVATLTEDQKSRNIWGIVEPRSGRLWMALYDKIFVLTFYPSSRISAWTWYDATTAPVDYLVTSDDSVYWRSGDNVFIYGGEDGDEYDDTEALARVPYIDAGKPATHKNWTGIDVALFGTWTVRGSFDPTVPAALDLFANLTKSTYAQQKVAINGESPGLSLELRSTYVGPARVGNAALHYTDSTAD
jgi:hypothetical protein